MAGVRGPIAAGSPSAVAQHPPKEPRAIVTGRKRFPTLRAADTRLSIPPSLAAPRIVRRDEGGAAQARRAVRAWKAPLTAATPRQAAQTAAQPSGPGCSPSQAQPPIAAPIGTSEVQAEVLATPSARTA